MTTPSSPPAPQNTLKLSGFSSCVVTVLAIFLAVLGVYDLVFGSIIAYVFSSAHMLSPATIAIVLVMACDCLIYFFLAFRLKRQHWLISLALLAVVWFVLPFFPLNSLINTTTMRLRVDGYAMGATLPNGSYILANKQAYQQNEPQRGDVVIL
ncbi:MAG TPA: S26 family signal peptidase, partial [Anaerolineales bacterium]|nr:S26 family signal peptidase [Anaerolineales bacterium]